MKKEKVIKLLDKLDQEIKLVYSSDNNNPFWDCLYMINKLLVYLIKNYKERERFNVVYVGFELINSLWNWKKLPIEKVIQWTSAVRKLITALEP